MRSRLVWALGGFALVALVLYRFLTRVPAPGDGGPDSAAEDASDAAPPASAPLRPWLVPPLVDEPGDGDSGAGPAGAAVASVDEDEEDDPDSDIALGDPDVRVRELRQKLDAARAVPDAAAAPSGIEPPEPGLDDRRRSVHAAARAAAEQMRRSGPRPARGDAAPADPDPA